MSAPGPAPSLPRVFAGRRGKLARLAIASAALALVSGWVAARCGLPPLDPTLRRWGVEVERTAGLAGLVLFGLGSVLFLRILLRPGRALVIDEEGLIDHVAGLSAGRLRWSDVARIEVARDGERGQVSVHLIDPEPYIASLPAPKRWLVRLNVSWGQAPVLLPGLFLEEPVEVVGAALQEAWLRYRDLAARPT